MLASNNTPRPYRQSDIPVSILQLTAAAVHALGADLRKRLGSRKIRDISAHHA